MALLWTIAWILLVSDSPAKHSRISQEEKDYIIAALNDGNEDAVEKKVSTYIGLLNKRSLHWFWNKWETQEIHLQSTCRQSPITVCTYIVYLYKHAAA